MKALNGDWLIEIMSQAEHSDEVLDLLEICKLDRLKYKGGFSQDIELKEFGIKLGFSGAHKSKKQKAEIEKGNLYFQNVAFRENCTIPLPLGLKKGDSRVTVVKKIYENEKKSGNLKILHIFRWDDIDDFLLEDKNKIYFFTLKYSKDSDKKIVNIYAFTWDTDMDLKNYMPNEISIEEALNEGKK